jgi:hypothetical protein
MKEREITTYGYWKENEVYYTRKNDFKTATIQRFKENERFIVIHREIYKKRSSPQNRYYWGVIIECYLQGVEETEGRPLGLEFLNKQTGQVAYFPLSHEEQRNKAHEALKEFFLNGKSTTDNTTTQQEEYHGYCRYYIKFAFNMDVPLPGEQGQLALK